MSAALAQLLRIVEHLVPTGVIGDGTVAELHSLAARVRGRKRSTDTPTSGREAFLSGWDDSACPHDPLSVEAMLWRSDWWRANAETFASHVGRPLPAGAGLPIGLSDREGRPVHIGDTLSFDGHEWGSPHEFTVRLEGGEVLISGAPSDIEEYCTVVRSWDA